MIFPFVLLVISLVCYMDLHKTRQTDMVFPEDLQIWCPYTKFCNLHASKPVPLDNQTGQAKFEPCCRPCSCSDDCGLRRDCCHSRYDRYKLDETIETVCKALNTKVLDGYENEHFRIIYKCPNNIESCKESNVSIYGSFSPVLSKTDGKIYYNYLCANCHNQTETLEFPPLLSCSIVPNKNLMDIINGLREKPIDCYVQFLVPNRIDISNHACSPRFIRDCRFDGLEQYREKCKAFNATFTKNFKYQNVYCYLCNKLDQMSVEIWERKNITKCPVTGQSRDFSKSAISVLLDRESIEMHEKSLLEPMADNTMTMCFEKSKPTSEKVCRPIKCPEGQILSEKSCRLFGSMWFIRKPNLYLTLTPFDMSSNITVQHLRQVSIRELASAIKEFIVRPELQDWDVDLYYKLKSENESEVQFILATLITYNKMVKPEKFLSQIQRALSGIWSMKINKEHYKLKPDFNKYKTYFKSVGNGSVFIPFSSPYVDFEVSYGVVHGWSEKSAYKFSTKSYFISKLFFCDRIELYEWEYVQVSPETIFVNRSMKYLGNGEYEPMELAKGVHVCLKDALLEASCSNTIKIYMTMFLVTFYIHNLVIG